MVNDRQLADAILLRVPDGATRFEIARNNNIFPGFWAVTIHLGEAFEGPVVSEVDTSLSAALAKANVSFYRKRAKES